MSKKKNDTPRSGTPKKKAAPKKRAAKKKATTKNAAKKRAAKKKAAKKKAAKAADSEDLSYLWATPSPDIDFRRIRAWNDSRRDAFEELCCQLFALQRPHALAEFRRKEGAGGDAGVECYWILPGGNEHCLQAKYFVEKLGDSQWSQLDSSVRTALNRHPRVVRYVVCLPINLADRRVKDETSQQDAWNKRVEKWNKWASDMGLAVDFVLWGAFELGQQLTQDDPVYSGRVLYWFNAQHLHSIWFEGRYDVARKNLGERYSPEINVDLPIARILSALAKAPSFTGAVLEDWRNWQDAFDSAASSLARLKQPALATPSLNLQREASHFQGVFNPAQLAPSAQLQLASLVGRGRDLEQAVSEMQRELWSLAHGSTRDADVDSAQHYVRELREALEAVMGHFASTAGRAAELGAVLLTGEAGIGKSHLLCDVAQHHIINKWPVLLLLGEHYTGGNPWDCYLSELGVARYIDRLQFLAALDSIAQALGVRALVLLDAINEGSQRNDWRARLPGFFEEFRPFASVAVAVSCRTAYARRLVEPVTDQTAVRVRHLGFRGHEEKAAAIFLERYGIARPSAPVTTPEFSNPLFLKTCCEALRSRGESSFPKGMQGTTALFEFYVESLDQRLALLLDLSPNARLASRALPALADHMATARRETVDRQDAETITTALYSAQGYSNSLLFHLISEGALAEDVDYSGHVSGGPDEPAEHVGTDVVRFTYQRFSDHLVAASFLETHVADGDPKTAFATTGELGFLLEETWRFPGVLAALSIQLPERYGVELPDLVTDEAASEKALDHTLADAFLGSLLWRDPAQATERTLHWLNQSAARSHNYEAFEVLLQVATEPRHKLGADLLHRNLIDLPLPKRDAWWSVYLAKNYYEDDTEASIAYRVVKWAQTTDHTATDADRARLTAITLCWFFTCSRREVRDHALKGVVAVLVAHPALIEQLLALFDEVDDLYLRERVYGAAYGAALLVEDEDTLRTLARLAFKQVFDQSEPTPHVLLRDYARGIVERAQHCGVLPEDVLLERCRPPYKSPWPLEDPGEMEIEALSGSRIHSSVLHGDFGIYTMADVHEFSATPLGEDLLSSDDLLERLATEIEASGTPDQASAAALWRAARVRAEKIRQGEPDPAPSATDAFVAERTALSRLAKSLSGNLADRFRWLSSSRDDPAEFSRKQAMRWVCRAAHDLGWESELFDDFERNHCRFGRGGQTATERIGKKYQWIAYHMLLARLADNLTLMNKWEKVSIPYQGPWQPDARDIDPSLLLRRTGHTPWAEYADTRWWRPFTVGYGDADEKAREKWLWDREAATPDDLRSLISLEDQDSREWLGLNTFHQWRESEKKVKPLPHRVVWLRLSSALVKAADQGALQTRVQGEDLRDDRADADWAGSLKFFLAEYPWHPSCASIAGEAGWRDGGEWRGDLPTRSYVPTLRYSRESNSLDYSLDTHINFGLPAPLLVNDLGLRLENGRTGRFVDERSQVVWQDPSVVDAGPSTSLVLKDRFGSFLQRNELAVAWFIALEKSLYGPGAGLGGGHFYGQQIINGIYVWDGSAPISGSEWTTRDEPHSDQAPVLSP